MKSNPRVNWGFMILLATGGTACAGAYEFAVNIIDNNAATAAASHIDEQGVEQTIISPNILQVKEPELETLFNFATGQLISRTRTTEDISFFSEMNRDAFVQSTLAGACALAASAQEKLKTYNSMSMLPWEDDEITGTRNTVRSFATRHCTAPTIKGPTL
jgi:hypothetical protein